MQKTGCLEFEAALDASGVMDCYNVIGNNEMMVTIN